VLDDVARAGARIRQRLDAKAIHLPVARFD